MVSKKNNQELDTALKLFAIGIGALILASALSIPTILRILIFLFGLGCLAVTGLEIYKKSLR